MFASQSSLRFDDCIRPALILLNLGPWTRALETRPHRKYDTESVYLRGHYSQGLKKNYIKCSKYFPRPSRVRGPRHN